MNIWDVDNLNLNVKEKYNRAINLYNNKELNSILPSLPEFNQYYKNSIQYMLNNLPEKYRILFRLGFNINNSHRLPILYSILLFKYDRNNSILYDELVKEVYRYLDSISYTNLPTVMLLIITRNKDLLVNYFVEKYLNNQITLDDIKLTINYANNTVILWTFQSIYERISHELLVLDQDITEIIKDLFILEDTLNEERYESVILFVLSRHATYEQLDRYMNKGLINLLDKDIISTMVSTNAYQNRKHRILPEEYKKLYNRFLYILEYYLNKGFNYQDLLEIITIRDVDSMWMRKLNVVMYLLNTDKVDFVNTYNKSSNEVKSRLDLIILDQI